MWNQSSGASIGALWQNLAQTNPRVLQQIMQIMQQRQQQGVGGIGSLPQPGSGGPVPMGGNLAMQVPPGGIPRTNGPSGFSGQMPSGGMWGMAGGNTGSKFYPPSGPKQYGSTQPSYTMPTGPKSYGKQGSYTAPTGPKSWGTPQPYTAPIGPKIYGQTMPAEQPPAFTAPSQPKVYGSPQPMAGDGATGLDWYAQQAGN